MKYFGTDGIRGIPGKNLTFDFLNKLGKAMKCLDSKEILVAYDTRYSNDFMFTAISSGCLEAGINVRFLGVVSTPALIYLSRIKKTVGIMITASHNPYIDNGIKIIERGRKLDDQEEKEIECFIDGNNWECEKFGKIIYDNELIDLYYQYVLANKNKTKQKICLDCANGATYKIAPYVFSRICNKLNVFAINPNGININEKVGSTNIEYLKKMVLNTKSDVGFAFDGDGDRVIAVSKQGKIIDGDILIYLLANYYKEKGKLNNNKIVLSIMSNLGIIKRLRDDGFEVVETKVGDKYIYESMTKYDAYIGGENSGHIITKYMGTGDGVYIALELIRLLDEKECGLDELVNNIEIYDVKNANIIVDNRNKVLSSEDLINRIEKIKKELNGDCKIIVRPSGTENVIRITVMSMLEKNNQKYINELIDIIERLWKYE